MKKNFVSTDPLGRRVLFYADTWTKHVEKEHPENPFTFEDACETLVDPDVIMDNQTGLCRKGRSGRQAYSRKIETSASGQHIYVPAKQTTEVLLVDGVEIEPGAMLALTAYPVSPLPSDSKRRYTKRKP